MATWSDWMRCRTRKKVTGWKVEGKWASAEAKRVGEKKARWVAGASSLLFYC
jgi:hypothetical protein